MLFRFIGAKCAGIDAVRVTTEVDISPGIGINLVGLADVAVKESLLRTATALQALGYRVPGKKIVINLAPADLHKNGSGYDLSIALGIIAASGQRTFPHPEEYLIMGELGLDGSLREIPGALPFAELAVRENLKGVILPEESALEGVEFKDDILIFGARSLEDAVRILEEKEDVSELLACNTQAYERARREAHHRCQGTAEVDFADIIGQEGAKRGIEIAAAGGHNAILIGTPGSGKSSLAKAIPGILPPMTREEAIVTSKIYSIAGKHHGCGLIRRRPFRAPHYSASTAAIIGGGGGDSILPGEVSMAQNGVLFCDEMAQMPRSVIESLRGPLEDRYVTISRLKSKVVFPASFMLVAASNPCPCGYWGEGDRCICTPGQRLNYLSRLSGPIMDRIDIQLLCRNVSPEEIAKTRNLAEQRETSATVAARVLKARTLQKLRFSSEPGINVNAEMGNKQIERYCPLSDACAETLSRLMEKMGLSMRAYFRIIKVARTIADLEGSDDILSRHILEAAGFRFLDRRQTF